MQSQDTPAGGRAEGSQLVVRPEIAVAVLHTLERDRKGFAEQTGVVAAEHVATIEQLTNAVQAGESIDLAAPRSREAAVHDGQSRTVAGYLLGLIRDTFSSGIGDWHQFIALGSLAVDVEAATEMRTS